MPSLLKSALLAVALAVLAPAAALAHPGHEHAGMPGVTSPFTVPFPSMGPSVGGFASDNVEFVKNFPQHTDSAGGRLHDGYFYITTERDLTIYDVSKPADPKEVGSYTFPPDALGQPVYTEEDPDTNGRILLVGNNDILLVIDVSDKTDPKLLSRLADADDHTITCVLDCNWAYGSEGTIVDLRDPAEPRLSENNWKTEDIESEHDVTEVSPGIILTSTQPIKLLDARKNPEQPAVLASMPLETGRFVHANTWPRGGTDDFLLVGGEAIGPNCSGSVSATFSTWDATQLRENGTAQRIDEFRLTPGLPQNGRGPESSFCVHWFTEHPYYENGGLVAIGWYEHGTHFLKIGDDGKISEVGFFLGGGGQSSAAYWIDERTVYIADYIRGLDVVRFNGDIGSPPQDDATGTPEKEADKQQPATKDPAPQAQQQPQPQAQERSAAACTDASGFRSVDVAPKGERLALAFSRSAQTPVTVEVFQQSIGRRITGERLVARFTGRGGDVMWNGKANRRGRTVTDGYYFVRYTTRTASGTDTRRVALRRVDGRWTTRPSFYRRAECDLLRSFKLERPVFGGRTNRALGITYQVERAAQVTVTVRRGARVVKRFRAQQADADRTYRLRFDSEGQPRGDYTVSIEARRDGERATGRVVSRRL